MPRPVPPHRNVVLAIPAPRLPGPRDQRKPNVVLPLPKKPPLFPGKPRVAPMPPVCPHALSAAIVVPKEPRPTRAQLRLKWRSQSAVPAEASAAAPLIQSSPPAAAEDASQLATVVRRHH